MSIQLHPLFDKHFPVEAAFFRYVENDGWAQHVSYDLAGGEYDLGVDDLLRVLEQDQVTPVPRDLIESVREIFTDPEKWTIEEIARANRVLDRVAAFGDPS